MAEKHVVKFHHIAQFFSEDMAYLTRGENAYTSGHVESLLFDGSVQPMLLKGTVHASMKKHKYNVEISYCSTQGITNPHCTCPRGRLSCHHIAALLLHAHYNISSTDIACQWKAVGKSPFEGTVKLKDIYQLKNPNYHATLRQINEEEVKNFKEAIGETSVVGFSWLLRSEPSHEFVFKMPDIEKIIFSENYLNAADKRQYILDNCQMSPADIENVAKETIGQHSNPNWHVARRHRLTASKFGYVLAACKRNKFPPSLFKSLVEGYSLNRVAAVQWGKEHEKTALATLREAKKDLVFESSGLWLDPCGFLGASPDGIGDNFTIEVKCPYKYRDVDDLSTVDKNYLFYYEDNNMTINGNHNYYHQIQGQLHILNKQICWVVIWTPKCTTIFPIQKCEEWANNLEILKKFYIEKYVSYITK